MACILMTCMAMAYTVVAYIVKVYTTISATNHVSSLASTFKRAPRKYTRRSTSFVQFGGGLGRFRSREPSVRFQRTPPYPAAMLTRNMPAPLMKFGAPPNSLKPSCHT